MKSKPRKRRERHAVYTEEVVSEQECTGLEAALPETGAEETNLARLYRIHAAKAPERP